MGNGTALLIGLAGLAFMRSRAQAEKRNKGFGVDYGAKGFAQAPPAGTVVRERPGNLGQTIEYVY